MPQISLNSQKASCALVETVGVYLAQAMDGITASGVPCLPDSAGKVGVDRRPVPLGAAAGRRVYAGGGDKIRQPRAMRLSCWFVYPVDSGYSLSGLGREFDRACVAGFPFTKRHGVP